LAQVLAGSTRSGSCNINGICYDGSMQQHAPNIRRLLTYKDLRAVGINFSREHFRRLEAAGKFPRRIYLGPQKLAWFEDEILAWIAERDAERTTRVYRVDA
jgi:prophage regulatory protein